MEIAIFHRGRFRPLPGATARHIAANAWEVHIPHSDKTERLASGKWGLTAFDGATLLLGDDETEQVVGSAQRGKTIVVSVLLG